MSSRVEEERASIFVERSLRDEANCCTLSPSEDSYVLMDAKSCILNSILVTFWRSEEKRPLNESESAGSFIPQWEMQQDRVKCETAVWNARRFCR